MNDLQCLAEDAAAFEFRREWRKHYADTNAFRVAYYILRDADEARCVVDRLWDEHRAQSTVEELPQWAPHGKYLFHDGEWKMAMEGPRRGGMMPFVSWSVQSPHTANEAYFREKVVREFDEFLAKRVAS